MDMSTSSSSVCRNPIETRKYAIFVPHEYRWNIYLLEEKEPLDFVFNSMKDCLMELKKYRDARFKSFQLLEDALDFVNMGPAQVKSENIKIPTKEIFYYSEPTLEEYKKLYKFIEKGNLKKFTELISRNPYYLVSENYTPAMIKNVGHFNALHLCCLKNKPLLCAKLLKAVSSADFVNLVNPMESKAKSKGLSNRLLDCYLNTPDGRDAHMTPLHYCLIRGYIGCARVLLSYPNCSRNFIDRYNSSTEFLEMCNIPSEEIRADMQMLLEDHYYVPIFHDEDKLFTSIVAEPMAPNLPLSEPDQQEKSSVGYTVIPSYKLYGYAGPMSHEQAKIFSSKWRQSIVSSPNTKRMNNNDMNSIGRKMAREMKVPFKEYWSFLGRFSDITNQGIRQLELHLKNMKIQAKTERTRLLDDSDVLGSDTNSHAVVSGQGLSNASPYIMGHPPIRSLSPCNRDLSMIEEYPRSLLSAF